MERIYEIMAAQTHWRQPSLRFVDPFDSPDPYTALLHLHPNREHTTTPLARWFDFVAYYLSSLFLFSLPVYAELAIVTRLAEEDSRWWLLLLPLLLITFIATLAYSAEKKASMRSNE